MAPENGHERFSPSPYGSHRATPETTCLAHYIGGVLAIQNIRRVPTNDQSLAGGHHEVTPPVVPGFVWRVHGIDKFGGGAIQHHAAAGDYVLRQCGGKARRPAQCTNLRDRTEGRIDQCSGTEIKRRPVVGHIAEARHRMRQLFGQPNIVLIRKGKKGCPAL